MNLNENLKNVYETAGRERLGETGRRKKNSIAHVARKIRLRTRAKTP